MGCPQEHVTYLTTQQNARSCKICPLNINPVEEVSREVAKGLCILRHVSPYLTRKQSEIYYSTIIRPCWSMEARYRLFVVRFKVYLSAAKRHPRYIFFYGLHKKEARDNTTNQPCIQAFYLPLNQWAHIEEFSEESSESSFKERTFMIYH